MKKTASILILIFVSVTIWAQSIPRSTPEAEGVSSASIEKFIRSFNPEKHELHSIMIIRHGKVISENWWAPYRSDMKHSMYSISKSWTSTAIGFAVSENRIRVQDQVISFFPEYQDLSKNPFMADLKIQDLLTMSVGHEKEPLRSVIMMQSDWIRGFLAWPIVGQPGTKFLYNTLSTYMLSAILQKVTGQSVLEYLEPRLLKPLGITGIDWEKDPKGINTGGWGIRVKTEDLAKLGLLYLNHGRWNGKQILSAAWVKEATTKHIDQNPMASQAKKDSSDWLQGYGYQFWRSRNQSFRGDGAYGQYMIVMPEQDAVVIITSESKDLQDELNMVWNHLLGAFAKEKLAPNKKAHADLMRYSKGLHLDLPTNLINSGNENLLNRTFELSKNQLDFTKFELLKSGDDLIANITTGDSKTHQIPLGFKKWAVGKTDLLGPYALRSARVDLDKLGPFPTASSYYWKDAITLVMTMRYIHSPHHWVLTYQVNSNKLNLKVINSFDQKNPIEISGN